MDRARFDDHKGRLNTLHVFLTNQIVDQEIKMKILLNENAVLSKYISILNCNSVGASIELNEEKLLQIRNKLDVYEDIKNRVGYIISNL